VIQEDNIGKPNKRSTSTQNKVPQANVRKPIVLSQNNRVIKIVLLLDVKIDQVLRNAYTHIFKIISTVI